MSYQLHIKRQSRQLTRFYSCIVVQVVVVVNSGVVLAPWHKTHRHVLSVKYSSCVLTLCHPQDHGVCESLFYLLLAYSDPRLQCIPLNFNALAREKWLRMKLTIAQCNMKKVSIEIKGVHCIYRPRSGFVFPFRIFFLSHAFVRLFSCMSLRRR